MRSDLYYYAPGGHPRWYVHAVGAKRHPALGHFVQADTIVPDAGYAGDYHRYACTRFNPVKYTDPTGHQASCMTDQAGQWTCNPNATTGGHTLTIDLQDEPPPCPNNNCSGKDLASMLGGMFVGSYTVMAGVAFTPQIIAWVTATGAKQACTDGDCTNEVQAAIGNSSKVVDFARSLQGSGNYPGVDRYTETVLRKGTVIYGGAPGQSNFYTTQEAVKAASGSAQKFFQGLQVAPHPQFGYRPGITAYEVLEDMPAAIGKALANPQHGTGGSAQIVIENFQQVLKPLYSIPFTK